MSQIAVNAFRSRDIMIHVNISAQELIIIIKIYNTRIFIPYVM